jgi:YD repeat-containing protein
VLTGSSNPQDKETAYAYNVAGYLLKEKLDAQCSQLIQLLEVYRKLNFSPMPTPIRQNSP